MVDSFEQHGNTLHFKHLFQHSLVFFEVFKLTGWMEWWKLMWMKRQCHFSRVPLIMAVEMPVCRYCMSASHPFTLFTDGGGQSQCAPWHTHCTHGGGRARLEAGWDSPFKGTSVCSSTCYTCSHCPSWAPCCCTSTKTSHVSTVSVTFLLFSSWNLTCLLYRLII